MLPQNLMNQLSRKYSRTEGISKIKYKTQETRDFFENQQAEAIRAAKSSKHLF
jgi:predicted transcriptional regulator